MSTSAAHESISHQFEVWCLSCPQKSVSPIDCFYSSAKLSNAVVSYQSFLIFGFILEDTYYEYVFINSVILRVKMINNEVIFNVDLEVKSLGWFCLYYSSLKMNNWLNASEAG